jgi:hypothetical protein
LKGVWQLPVLERRTINEQYIKHNAKYHYYEYEEPKNISISPLGKSLCNKHIQQVENFESIESEKVMQYPNTVCKKCYEKFKKDFKPNCYSNTVNGRCYGKPYSNNFSIPQECLNCNWYAFNKNE